MPRDIRDYVFEVIVKANNASIGYAFFLFHNSDKSCTAFLTAAHLVTPQVTPPLIKLRPLRGGAGGGGFEINSIDLIPDEYDPNQMISEHDFAVISASGNCGVNEEYSGFYCGGLRKGYALTFLQPDSRGGTLDATYQDQFLLIQFNLINRTIANVGEQDELNGSSGSPVWSSESGAVVGVFVGSQARGAFNLFAVSIGSVVEKIKEKLGVNITCSPVLPNVDLPNFQASYSPPPSIGFVDASATKGWNIQPDIDFKPRLSLVAYSVPEFTIVAKAAFNYFEGYPKDKAWTVELDDVDLASDSWDEISESNKKIKRTTNWLYLLATLNHHPLNQRSRSGDLFFEIAYLQKTTRRTSSRTSDKNVKVELELAPIFEIKLHWHITAIRKFIKSKKGSRGKKFISKHLVEALIHEARDYMRELESTDFDKQNGIDFDGIVAPGISVRESQTDFSETKPEGIEWAIQFIATPAIEMRMSIYLAYQLKVIKNSFSGFCQNRLSNEDFIEKLSL